MRLDFFFHLGSTQDPQFRQTFFESSPRLQIEENRQLSRVIQVIVCDEDILRKPAVFTWNKTPKTHNTEMHFVRNLDRLLLQARLFDRPVVQQYAQKFPIETQVFLWGEGRGRGGEGMQGKGKEGKGRGGEGREGREGEGRRGEGRNSLSSLPTSSTAFASLHLHFRISAQNGRFPGVKTNNKVPRSEFLSGQQTAQLPLHTSAAFSPKLSRHALVTPWPTSTISRGSLS